MAGHVANVLVVEDDPNVCHLIEDALTARHMACRSVGSAAEARPLLLTGDYDVVIVDLLLPGENGLDLLKFISQYRLDTRAICVSGVPSTDSDRLVRQAGACEFFEKPFDIVLFAEAVLRAAFACGREDAGQASGAEPAPAGEKPSAAQADGTLKDFDSYRTALLGSGPVGPEDKHRQMLMEFAGALVVAVEAKDPYTRRHSEHVAFYAENVARHAGLSAHLRGTIRIAGLLHDVGKIAIPDSVLTKPGKLSPKETALVRQHPTIGAGILENISLMTAEARLVRQHHENWDGSGYPAGLSGMQIVLGARVLNIADSIDAMLMHRTHKYAYPVPRMLGELQRCAGTQYDPTLAHAAIDWCHTHPASLILPEQSAEAQTA